MCEVTDIMESVTRSWVENGTGLICSRCGRVFVPSATSDTIYCGMCLPCNGLALGDHGKQYPKCVICKKDILGRRGDAEYCGPSCKKAAYRSRLQEQEEQDMGEEAKGGQVEVAV
jgi:hypothetical protein